LQLKVIESLYGKSVRIICSSIYREQFG